MAVPGSLRNRAAAGTNELFRDGATLVTTSDDVLLSLRLDHAPPGAVTFDRRPRPRGATPRAYRAVPADPRTLGERGQRAVGALIEAAMSLARLERRVGCAGRWLVRGDGSP